MSDKRCVYTVVSGDNFILIARRFGFRDYRAIYDHPLNADFKAKRPDPTLIVPGDEIVIPNLAIKKVSITPGTLVVYKLVKETPIQSKKQVGILPIRYAFDDTIRDDITKPITQNHPFDTTKNNLKAGLIESTMRERTLRQMRDGWLYVYNETKKELDEYEIIGSSYHKYQWDTIEQHTASQVVDVKSLLLYLEDERLALSFSQFRWTDRICEQMSLSEENRKDWMRQLDVNDYANAEHTADISQLGELVADIDMQDDSTFANTCIPLVEPELDGEDDGLMSYKPASTADDNLADLPEHTDAIVIALDDSFADIKDLFFALAIPYAKHSAVMGNSDVEIEENTRKWEMAHFTRGLARVELGNDELPHSVTSGAKRKDKFHADLNDYLKDIEERDKRNKEAHYAYPLALSKRVEETSQYLLAEYGFESSVAENKAWIAQEKRTYQDEVNWTGLDQFVAKYENKIDAQIPFIKQAYNDLLKAMQSIQVDVMRYGLDIGEIESITYLINLSETLISMLTQTALDESAQEALIATLIQEDPDNIFALTKHCFSVEFKNKFEELISLEDSEDRWRQHDNHIEANDRFLLSSAN